MKRMHIFSSSESLSFWQDRQAPSSFIFPLLTTFIHITVHMINRKNYRIFCTMVLVRIVKMYSVHFTSSSEQC